MVPSYVLTLWTTASSTNIQSKENHDAFQACVGLYNLLMMANLEDNSCHLFIGLRCLETQAAAVGIHQLPGGLPLQGEWGAFMT